MSKLERFDIGHVCDEFRRQKNGKCSYVWESTQHLADWLLSPDV